jgi:hypothetical protein
MIRAWTKRVLVGCFLAGPIACVVSVNDDPIDDDIDGTSGSTNSSGSGGSSGSSAGTSSGGSSAQGGSAGSLSMVENGGSGGAAPVTAVCTAEAGDAADSCLSCIKQQCCTEWQGCNDSGCQQEREEMVECVRMLDVPDAESYGDCISMVSPEMNFLQQNTEQLLDCVNEFITEGDAGATKSRCGTECWGEDIFFD